MIPTYACVATPTGDSRMKKEGVQPTLDGSGGHAGVKPLVVDKGFQRMYV